MSLVIDRTIKLAAERFKASLCYFYPAYNNNGFNERNLTYQFAKEFERRDESCAFMEVPYHNPKFNKYNKRIDCLVTDPNLAVFVESKRLYNSIKAAEMAKDVERLNRKNTNAILSKLSERGVPEHIYMLLLAETWQPSVVAWWCGEKTRITWNKSLLPGDITRKSIKVSEHSGKSLYWLYGYKKI